MQCNQDERVVTTNAKWKKGEEPPEGQFISMSSKQLTVSHCTFIHHLVDLPFQLMGARRLLLHLCHIWKQFVAVHSDVKVKVPLQNAWKLAGLLSLLHFRHVSFILSALRRKKKNFLLTILLLLIFCSTEFNSSTCTMQPGVVLSSYWGPWWAGSSVLH